MKIIEYRVRPVTRFIVTRYEREASEDGRACTAGKSSTVGEYDNGDVAYQVGYAVCKAEHDRLGWPPGDMRIQYPDSPQAMAPVHPNDALAAELSA